MAVGRITPSARWTATLGSDVMTPVELAVPVLLMLISMGTVVLAVVRTRR
jgi:hypothetical protein